MDADKFSEYFDGAPVFYSKHYNLFRSRRTPKHFQFLGVVILSTSITLLSPKPIICMLLSQLCFKFILLSRRVTY